MYAEPVTRSMLVLQPQLPLAAGSSLKSVRCFVVRLHRRMIPLGFEGMADLGQRVGGFAEFGVLAAVEIHFMAFHEQILSLHNVIEKIFAYQPRFPSSVADATPMLRKACPSCG